MDSPEAAKAKKYGFKPREKHEATQECVAIALPLDHSCARRSVERSR